jgi:dihydropteroate synthase
VVADVRTFLGERMEIALDRGVTPEQILLDPGPDFAKQPAESALVLRELATLADLGRPVLAAVGRKYFIGAITGRPPLERLPGTLAAVGFAADRGAAMVRVHDVAEAVEYLHVRAVLAGDEPFPAFDRDDERLKWHRP